MHFSDQERKKPLRTMEETSVLPTDIDVLCGSGNDISQHRGNIRFRLIIAKHYERYALAATKTEKTKVTRRIFDQILLPGTRFLKKHPIFPIWSVAGLKVGRDKISHSLREIANQVGRGIDVQSQEHVISTANTPVTSFSTPSRGSQFLQHQDQQQSCQEAYFDAFAVTMAATSQQSATDPALGELVVDSRPTSLYDMIRPNRARRASGGGATIFGCKLFPIQGEYAPATQGAAPLIDGTQFGSASVAKVVPDLTSFGNDPFNSTILQQGFESTGNDRIEDIPFFFDVEDLYKMLVENDEDNSFDAIEASSSLWHRELIPQMFSEVNV